MKVFLKFLVSNQSMMYIVGLLAITISFFGSGININNKTKEVAVQDGVVYAVSMVKTPNVSFQNTKNDTRYLALCHGITRNAYNNICYEKHTNKKFYGKNVVFLMFDEKPKKQVEGVILSGEFYNIQNQQEKITHISHDSDIYHIINRNQMLNYVLLFSFLIMLILSCFIFYKMFCNYKENIG